MSLCSPDPPEDEDQKFIIDQFVLFRHRNGPEFEEYTKFHQKDNPEFAFLFGRDHSDYYNHKLRQLRDPNSQPFSSVFDVEALTSDMKIPDELRNHVVSMKESLRKLSRTLLKEEDAKILRKLTDINLKEIRTLFEDPSVLSELDRLLSGILENCSKDAIYNSKTWILNTCRDRPQYSELIVRYIVGKILCLNSFVDKLHVVYLLNDLAHHSVRKNTAFLRFIQDHVVVGYASALRSAESTEKAKLERIIPIWEGNKYFDREIFEKLETAHVHFDKFMDGLRDRNRGELEQVLGETQSLFMGRLETCRNEIWELMKGLGHVGDRGSSDGSHVAYYELPASSMMSLIGIDDFEYKPLDGSKITWVSGGHVDVKLESALDEFYKDVEKDG